MLQRLLQSFLLVGFVAAAAHATTPIRPPLMATVNQSTNAEEPIQLRSLHISGAISGGLAETTVEMVFFNPNHRQLEGNLQFPLLDGQQITAFALDIDGQLRPAVPVEKTKGRQIFESIERRRVDPALLEATQGNNFKLRVYPIAAQGTRTVQLKYAEPLTRQGGNWLYRLPLAYGERLQDFDLTINVQGSSAMPQASGALGAVTFERSENRIDSNNYQAHVAKNKFASSGTLRVLLPMSEKPQTYTQVRDGDTYFIAEIPVSSVRIKRVLPKVIGLLWDSSGSGAGRAHEAELAELDQYFRAVGNGEVRLTRLRDRAEATESFKIVNGNWNALRTSLQNTVYDGASALADWKPQADVGEYLLLSDGLINYGPARFPQLAPNQRLYALNASLVADTNRLSALAERSGGRLIQVVPQTPGAAAQELLTEGTHLSNLRANGATDLQIESADPQHGLIRIAGRLLNPTAQVQMTATQQGKSHTITIPVTQDAPSHPLAAHLWATFRLRMLEADYELQRAEIRRLGQKFGLPTRETSLIVLDSLEDYVRYDITPPASYLSAFNQLKAARSAQLKQMQGKQLERVLHDFNEKITWWEKTYPKDPPAKPEPKAKAAMPAAEARADSAEDHARQLLSRQSRNESSERRAAMPAPAATAGNLADAKAAADSTGSQHEVGIALKKWTSDAPYITRMQAASADTIYAVYLDEKPGYNNSSAFFLDAADMLLEKGRRDLALRVLSNLAEMDLENRQVLRILGYRLLQADAPELAIPVFEKILRIAEEEPQSFRDLGLAHAAAKHYQQAIDQLNDVVLRPWDARFAEIELIALAELNAIVATAPTTLDTSRIDPRLLKNMPLDLRAVLTWDADNTDMDLWVTDPNGEKCYYGHRFTYQGGRNSIDFTGGYGPEEFSLRDAKPGKYKIEVNFFGSRQQTVAGATTLQVKLTSGFGTGKAKDQMISLRLKERSETVFVGEFEVKPR